MIETLNDSTETKAKKAKLKLQAAEKLRRRGDLKEKLESYIGLKDDEMPALLLLEEEHFERMDFNKVVLVAGSWHYDCSQIASAMQTVEADFEYKEPASVGKSRFPSDCWAIHRGLLPHRGSNHDGSNCSRDRVH